MSPLSQATESSGERTTLLLVAIEKRSLRTSFYVSVCGLGHRCSMIRITRAHAAAYGGPGSDGRIRLDYATATTSGTISPAAGYAALHNGPRRCPLAAAASELGLTIDVPAPSPPPPGGRRVSSVGDRTAHGALPHRAPPTRCTADLVHHV